MLKAVELFHAQYKEIIDDDRRSYDQKQAEITTLLSAAGIVSRLDREGFREAGTGAAGRQGSRGFDESTKRRNGNPPCGQGT